MTLLVTLRSPVMRAVAAVRDRAAARDAAAAYQASFRELDATARQLRAGGWDEGAEILQQYAAIAYTAARAERRHLEE
jgi:hypothetical protein